MELRTLLVDLTAVQPNTGQVPGVPANPRFIRDARYDALKRSIAEFPEMLEIREVVVFPFKKKFVAIGGNMRYRACKDLGHEKLAVKVLPKDFPAEKLAEFAIKDNVGFGQDDIDLLANQWTDFPLQDWGMELPDLSDINLDEFFKEDTSEPKAETFSITLEFKTQKECDRIKQALLEYGQTYEIAIRKLLKL